MMRVTGFPGVQLPFDWELDSIWLGLLCQEECLGCGAVARVLLQLHTVRGRCGWRIQAKPTVAGDELIRSVPQRDRLPLLVGPSSIAPELDLHTARGRPGSSGDVPNQGCIAVRYRVVAAVRRRKFPHLISLAA